VAFGGAGPLHACDLAELLSIPRVLVPRFPGVLSALGMVVAPVTRSFIATVMLPVNGDEFASTLDRQVKELLENARAALSADGYDVRRLHADISLSMRYAGQSYELNVPQPRSRGRRPIDATAWRNAFHDAHRQRYGHADPNRPVEAVSLFVRAVLPPPRVDLHPQFEDGEARIGSAAVWFDRRRRAAIMLRERLRPGDTFAGPAIVPQMDATTVVPPGWRARVDDAANLILEPR
jgi:N-methylhydantoinase A